jgi:hypothetical protein
MYLNVKHASLARQSKKYIQKVLLSRPKGLPNIPGHSFSFQCLKTDPAAKIS